MQPQTLPVKCVSWHRARGSRLYPADMRVTVMDTCPLCRSNMTMVMRIFMDTWIETMETVENYERVPLRNVDNNKFWTVCAILR